MIKAIKITTLIYNILFIISILACIGLGILFAAFTTQDKQVAEIAEKYFKDSTDPIDAAKVFLVAMAVMFFIFAAIYIVGMIFNIILRNGANNEFANMSKGKIIAFGVLGFVFGANVPGVLTIIYGAINGGKSSNSEEVAE